MDKIIAVILVAVTALLLFADGTPAQESSIVSNRFSSTELALPRFLARINSSHSDVSVSHDPSRALGGATDDLDFSGAGPSEAAAGGNTSENENAAIMPRVTSGFGFRRMFGVTRHHDGIDIAAKHGTPIRAHQDGMVTFSGWQGGYGQCVIIDHGNGRETLYAHASRLDVREGDYVYAGEEIARVGATGRAYGDHLHFEIRQDGVAFDPERAHLEENFLRGIAG